MDLDPAVHAHQLSAFSSHGDSAPHAGDRIGAFRPHTDFDPATTQLSKFFQMHGNSDCMGPLQLHVGFD